MAEVLESALKNTPEHLQKICDIICNVTEKDLDDAESLLALLSKML